jgi:RNA polymerase sigma factor (sigma-70 family)
MWGEDEQRSDSELVAAVHAGDTAAFDALFRRHYDDARDFANRFAGRDHAEDRVAEAFARVYRILLNGGGPDANFRAYLFSSIRNAHYDSMRRSSSHEVATDDLGVDEPAPIDVESDVIARLDAAPIRRAFVSLRPAWKKVLWYTAVLGEPNEKVAERLGSNPNAVGVLAFRAREGLRQAYLAEHVRSADGGNCNKAAKHLPKFVRGQLNHTQAEWVAQHVDDCLHCQRAVADLTQLNQSLGAVLTPGLVLATPISGLAGSKLGIGALLHGTVGTKAVAVVSGVTLGAVGLAGFVVFKANGEGEKPVGTPPAAAPTSHSQTPTPQPTSAPPTSSEPPATVDPSPTHRTPTPVDVETPTPSHRASPSPTAVRPASMTQPVVTVAGSDQTKTLTARVDVVPSEADTILIEVTNVADVVVTSPGADCAVPGSQAGAARVKCTLRPRHPDRFALSLQAAVVDSTQQVVGTFSLQGSQRPVNVSFAVAAS